MTWTPDLAIPGVKLPPAFLRALGWRSLEVPTARETEAWVFSLGFLSLGDEMLEIGGERCCVHDFLWLSMQYRAKLLGSRLQNSGSMPWSAS